MTPLLDEATWRASLFGKPLNLTRLKFRLLKTLHKRLERIYSKVQLLDMAFPDDRDVFDRTIDSHIKNIRLKVKTIATEVDLIRSVYDVGYAFSE